MSMYGETETGIKCGRGRTKQSMKDECDINLIVATYVKTGFLSHVAKGLPTYVDVSELTDYRSALEHVRSVEDYFKGFPALVRAHFGNDAVAFMEYLETDPSREDMEEIGLMVLAPKVIVEDPDIPESAGAVPAPEVEPPEPASTLPT